MNVLITGGAGFIGSNLVRHALTQGIEVTVLDDLSTGYIENIDGLDVRLVRGSVLDSDAVRKAMIGVHSVIHLAALGSVPRSILDPISSHAANATGTLTVLEEARKSGVGHLLVTSSSSVYGMNPAIPKGEREWVRPTSPYAVTKLATEQYALAYQQSYGMNTMAFRLFNVYGPRQRAGHPYAAVIPVFIDSVLHGKLVPINGDGNQTRDFTFVSTVCQVLLDASVRGLVYPEPVNLAFGTNTSLNELLGAICTLAGRSPGIRRCGARPGDVAHSRADNTVLRTLFPDIEPVPLLTGLTETMAWQGGMR